MALCQQSEHTGFIGNYDIKCKEEQQHASYFDCNVIDNEGDVVIDSSRMEHAKKKKTRRKTRKEMKTVPGKGEMDNTASKSDEFPKQDTSSLTSEGSQFTVKALCDQRRNYSICSKRFNSCKQGTEGVSTIKKNFQEGLSSRNSSKCNSYKITDSKFGLGKSCYSGCWNSNFGNVHVTKRSDAVNVRYHRRIWRANENSPLNWQKSGRNYKKSKFDGVSKSDCSNLGKDMNFRERNSCAQRYSFAGQGLLPMPTVSSAKRSNSACEINRILNTERKMPRGFPSQTLSQQHRVPKHKLKVNSSQHFSLSNGGQDFDCDKSRLFSHCSFGCGKNLYSGIGWGGYRKCLSRLDKHVFSQRILQVPFQLHCYNYGYTAQRTSYSNRCIITHGSYCRNSPSAAFAWVPQRFTGWVPSTNQVLSRCFGTYVDGTIHSRLKFYSEYRVRNDMTYGTRSKWVPVCIKDSGMLDKPYPPSVCDSDDSLQLPHDKPLSIPTSLSDSKSLSSISSGRITSAENEAPKSEDFFTGQRSAMNDMPCPEKSRDASQFRGSQVTMEALNPAQKLQVASQCIQPAMDHQIAEFERFLHSAAPVVTSFSVYKNQLSNSSPCQHQIPNISLQAIWNWFEKPGNYGLEVKARGSQTLNGLLAESIPFCAYFVPFLSAVQLFSWPHLSDSCGKDQSHAKPELIFEFFESEKPHLRKPLHIKIWELIGIGTSNLQVFGDPSKLGSSNLHDLHPTSWFSVAWYPIYRIPEGKFRASFLTYHSFGQAVVSCIPIDSCGVEMLHLVFPVIGLQNYNTQGECWFDLRTLTNSSEETIALKAAEILRVKLKKLEESALLLSTGVTEDKVKVVSRHPDFEFFISQKDSQKY